MEYIICLIVILITLERIFNGKKINRPSDQTVRLIF